MSIKIGPKEIEDHYNALLNILVPKREENETETETFYRAAREAALRMKVKSNQK